MKKELIPVRKILKSKLWDKASYIHCKLGGDGDVKWKVEINVVRPVYKEIRDIVYVNGTIMGVNSEDRLF